MDIVLIAVACAALSAALVALLMTRGAELADGNLADFDGHVDTLPIPVGDFWNDCTEAELEEFDFKLWAIEITNGNNWRTA